MFKKVLKMSQKEPQANPLSLVLCRIWYIVWRVCRTSDDKHDVSSGFQAGVPSMLCTYSVMLSLLMVDGYDHETSKCM